MSTFTVASGPINFGTSGGDEDFFGGSSTNADQVFTAAAAYAQPESSPEFPPTSYGDAPWDVSGGYATQEPVTYPAAHPPAAADDVYQQPAPPQYSNPLYDAAATYQPPQTTAVQFWAAPQAEAAPEYSYEPPAAVAPLTTSEDLSSAAAYPEAVPQNNPEPTEWNTAPAPVASYEDSVAKRELSFNENIALTNFPAVTTTTTAPPAATQQQQPVQQPTPWTMPAANPSMNFTEEDNDAALFDQIDASYSGNVDTDSIFSGTITTSAPSTAAAPTAVGAAAMPVVNAEDAPHGKPFSPPRAPSMTHTATGFMPSPHTYLASPTVAAAAPPPPPPPPMSPPPSFSHPTAHPPPPAAPPTYQYEYSNNTVPTYSAVVPQLSLNTIAAPATAPAAAATTSGSVSRVSSLGSSPRPGNVNLEAGRRKLEEYKRRKQAAMGARKTPGASASSSPLAGANSSDSAAAAAAAAAAVTEKFQAELDAAISRATAAEASSAELSRDLDHVLRQLESVDQERNSLQREKAAMVGEMMALQAALETAQAQAQNTSSAQQDEANKLQNAEMQIQELEAARNDLITLLEKERSDHRQQLNMLQSEKDTAVLQGDENSQRAAQHVEEVQQWISATQADSQAVREDNERLRQELETALAALAAANASSGKIYIKQEEDQQQQQSQEEFYRADDDQYIDADLDSTTSNMNAAKVEEALARASAAESGLAALQSELESARQEASALREDVARLQNEAAAMDKLHLDSPSNSRRAVNNDPESLRYRLAKAEAAVEKERRMIQTLERQVCEGEGAAAEGRASTAAAFELRRRCDAAEREAAAAKATIEQLQSAAGSSMPDAQVQQMLSRLRIEEEKAISTAAIAADLRGQCDAAAKTISKLVEENQNLMDRLNRQGNAMAELQESHHEQNHAHQYSPDVRSAPAHHHYQPQQQQHHHHQHQEQEQQFKTPSPTQTARAPVWNLPGAVPMQPPPHGGDAYNGGFPSQAQGEIQQQGRYDYGGGGGRGGDLNAPSPVYNQENTRGTAAADGGGKKKGFWSWLAGEDLVD